MSKPFQPLIVQTATTLENLRMDYPLSRGDKVFLAHLLEELSGALNPIQNGLDYSDEESHHIADSFKQLIGSTNELIEDGLEY